MKRACEMCFRNKGPVVANEQLPRIGADLEKLVDTMTLEERERFFFYLKTMAAIEEAGEGQSN